MDARRTLATALRTENRRLHERTNARHTKTKSPGRVPYAYNIATDHAGLELSHYLIESLTAAGYEMIDHGPADYDPLYDYPSFCIIAALWCEA